MMNKISMESRIKRLLLKTLTLSSFVILFQLTSAQAADIEVAKNDQAIEVY